MDKSQLHTQECYQVCLEECWLKLTRWLSFLGLFNIIKSIVFGWHHYLGSILNPLGQTRAFPLGQMARSWSPVQSPRRILGEFEQWRVEQIPTQNSGKDGTMETSQNSQDWTHLHQSLSLRQLILSSHNEGAPATGPCQVFTHNCFNWLTQKGGVHQIAPTGISTL